MSLLSAPQPSAPKSPSHPARCRGRHPRHPHHRRPPRHRCASCESPGSNQGQRKNIPSAEKHKGPGSTRKAQSKKKRIHRIHVYSSPRARPHTRLAGSTVVSRIDCRLQTLFFAGRSNGWVPPLCKKSPQVGGVISQCLFCTLYCLGCTLHPTCWRPATTLYESPYHPARGTGRSLHAASLRVRRSGTMRER